MRHQKCIYTEERPHTQKTARPTFWSPERKADIWHTACSTVVLDLLLPLRFKKLKLYLISLLLWTILHVDNKDLEVIHLSVKNKSFFLVFVLGTWGLYVLGSLKIFCEFLLKHVLLQYWELLIVNSEHPTYFVV